LRYVVDNQVVERIDRNVAILLGSWATTFLKRMTLVIGSVYTLYNHVQDVRPYQSRRVILILMVENQHTAKSLKTQD
jgi:hypothetical protein